MELRFQRTARCMHLAVLLLASPAALAANFNVSPVRLEFTPDQRAIAVTLTNGDDRPVVVETRAFLWTQAMGKDVLTPTTDLVITPPLVEVPPNGVQVIRVGRRSQVIAGAVEKTYRMMLQEVVPAAESAKPGLHFALRISMPIFIAPRLARDVRPAWTADWTAAPTADGQLALALHNGGNRRLQVTQVAVEDEAKRPLAKHDGMFYVLAGQSHALTLKPGAKLPPLGAPLAIKSTIESGDHLARVTLAKP